MTPATIYAPERKTPTLAFFAAISLLVSPVAITTASAHGGDESLVHACVGRDKLVRAVGPSKRCKGSQKAIHWEIEEPNPLSGLTVVDATGRPVGQTVEVEARNAEVLLTVGGREVDLGVSPNGFGYVAEVSGFSETGDGHLGDAPYFIYPDSLDCSGTPHVRMDGVSPTFAPVAYADLTFVYNDNGQLVAQNLFFADPQTPPRVLSEGAVYSVFAEGAGVNGEDACVQQTIQPGEGETQLLPVQFLGDLMSFGFVTPFRLQ